MTEQKILEIMQENKKYKLLEDEIGCPLEVREKALKQDFIYNGFTKMLHIYCKYDDNGCYLTNGCNKYYLKDHQKTWWLKENKEE